VDVEEGKSYYYCTCGRSKNQPFCDGSHQGTKFTPKEWKATATETKYFCACRQSANGMFCDGSHAKLPEDAEGKLMAPPPAPSAVPDIEDCNKVYCAKRGPIPVDVEEGKSYYYCTCGRSKNQPFCDGSHQGTTFTPKGWTATATETKYFCACRQSADGMFCDGSHQALPEDAEGQLMPPKQ